MFIKYVKISAIFLFFVICLSPIPICPDISQILSFNGYPTTKVPNPSSKVGDLQDTAYTYTGADCVVDYYGIHIDDDVTIVVIDYGLSSDYWEFLEDNSIANIDIIGFLTEDYDESTVKWITNRNDPYLDDQFYTNHGLHVCSVIASIARDVEVIFIDLEKSYDPYGFEYADYKLWEWIDDHQSTYDIDIVTTSISTSSNFKTTAIEQIWDNLISNGVIMLSAAGNNGNYKNYYIYSYMMYPQYYSEWYCVGSINHETRESGQKPGNKDELSSFSSWYEDDETDNHIVNWLDPGNGIPILKTDPVTYTLKWYYAWGTSFSTPYLAAIIALVITGYHSGIGSSTDPSVQKVIDILMYASSRSTFHVKLGYGYVDAYLAYGRAYTEGRLAR